MKTILLSPRSCVIQGGFIPNQLLKMMGLLKLEVVIDGPHDLALWLSDNPQRDPHFINARLFRLDKSSIGFAHPKAFGYPVDVDTATYHGLAVEKSLRHNQHGKVVHCPCHASSSKVYQRLLTNKSGPDGKMEELRLYIYGSETALMLKHLDTDEHGFPPAHRRGPFMTWRPTPDPLTPVELEQVKSLCHLLSVQCAVLDIIRDVDGRIYVIDVTILMGVPEVSWLSNCTQEQYLADNAAMFERAFLK